MNPWALWRWMGSTEPGGYSTVIIRPSLPGNSFRSLENSDVTFASLFSTVAALTAIPHNSINISFVIFIRDIHFFVCAGVEPKRCGCAGSAEPASIWPRVGRRSPRGGRRRIAHILSRGLFDPGFERRLTKPGIFAG